MENPYDHAGEFKVTVIESDSRNGLIRNPYNKASDDAMSDLKLPTIDRKLGLRNHATSKSSFESLRLEKLKDAEKREGNAILLPDLTTRINANTSL